MKNILKISIILITVINFNLYSAHKALQTIKVAQQSGADCGYHALKKCIYG